MEKYQLNQSFRTRFAVATGFFSGLVLVFLFYVVVLKIRPELPRFSGKKIPYEILQSATIVDYLLLILIWFTAGFVGGYITYRMAKVLKMAQGLAVGGLLVMFEVLNILAVEMLWVVLVPITLNVLKYFVNSRDKRMRLEAINTQLETQVEERTAEITRQKEIVERQKEDILDSIKYAKRLQDAILPPVSAIAQALPESFVLYKPKDIVAGDFYWMERFPLPTGEGQGEVTLIAACDCTGHGVPGALVSVVCSNALNRAVKEFGIKEPGKILDKVRELVLETFEKSEGNVQDGMDVSLACLSPTEGGIKLSWAGAYNSLWYVEKGEPKEIGGDKQPIGKTDNPKPFTTHNLTLPKGSTLYLFSDGYADQFGGPKGKKFKYKQLQQVLIDNCNLPMAEQKKALDKSLERWKGDLEQVDDILIIGIRI
jgi:serine phosphatase RsbU (regulator of sigma subunit)